MIAGQNPHSQDLISKDMKKANRPKLHKRDSYYIIDTVGVIAAIIVAVALAYTFGEASE